VNPAKAKFEESNSGCRHERVVEEDKGIDIDKANMLNKRDRNPTAVVIAVDPLRKIQLRGYYGEH
jgi:hypothetical protein